MNLTVTYQIILKNVVHHKIERGLHVEIWCDKDYIVSVHDDKVEGQVKPKYIVS